MESALLEQRSAPPRRRPKSFRSVALILYVFGGCAIAAFLAWRSSTTSPERLVAGDAAPTQDVGQAVANAPTLSANAPSKRADSPALAKQPAAPVKREAPPLDCNVTLRVQKKRVALPGATGQDVPRELEVLTYNGKLVGPTIRVRRGGTLHVNLINELPQREEPAASPVAGQPEPPHDLYTTNLHVHGLHVSPSGDSDNVFLEVPPGASYQYTYKIPADHPAGTFWYHPHRHGAVAYQIANGLAGALIVEGGDPPGQTRDLDDIPEIAQARERILVVQQFVVRTGPDGVGHVDPRDVYDEAGAAGQRLMLVNGELVPTYVVQPGEVERWRVVSAIQEDSIQLCWCDEHVQRINHWPLFEIAYDGLPTGSIEAGRYALMYSGNRSDVLAKAPKRPGIYHLAALQEDNSPGSLKSTLVPLARIVVQGPEKPMPLPKADELRACRPFEQIAADECVVKRNFVMTYDQQKKLFQINGASYSQQTSEDKPALGTAEEWTVVAPDPPEGTAPEAHPFHVHVNPFEVIRVEGPGIALKENIDEWRDTLGIEPGQKVTLRIRFRDFAGKTVLHCHTLDHGDQGMMRTLEVVDPNRPDAPNEPDDRRLAERGDPAPLFRLRAADGSRWNSKTAAGRPMIVVFFRGMWCEHCVRELRELLQETHKLAGSDAIVVAVSGEAIDEPAKVTKSLAALSGVEFRLLVDEQHDVFRRYGCFDQITLHGLFVIDGAGLIRASYVGPTPFADSKLVCDRVRQLLAFPAPKR